MKSITTKEAQSNFNDLLVNAESEPVSITRNGKEKGVLLSSKEYHVMKLQLLQNAIDDGFESGQATLLDINQIKSKARKRLGLNVN